MNNQNGEKDDKHGQKPVVDRFEPINDHYCDACKWRFEVGPDDFPCSRCIRNLTWS